MSKPQKILFIISSLAGGGAERFLIQLLCYLDRAHFEPVVVTLTSVDDYRELLPKGIRVICLHKKKFSDYFSLIFVLAKIFKAEKPALLYSLLPYANVLTLLAKKASKQKTPLILGIRNHYSSNLKTSIRFPFLMSMLVKKLYLSADKMICVSQGVKDDLVSAWGMPEERTMFIHNPVNIAGIQALANKQTGLNFNNEKPFIIASGRLEPQKNYPLLLEALALVLKKTDVDLIILGKGKLEATLIAYAQKLGIADNVTFLGFQKNPFKYIAQAKLFVLSSSFEGFPNVLLEAMVCGTPVVSTNCPSGPDEIITSGLNGLIVPVDDVAAMAAAIIKVLNDPALRQQLATAGKNRAAEFDTNCVMSRYTLAFENEIKAHQNQQQTKTTITQ